MKEIVRAAALFTVLLSAAGCSIFKPAQRPMWTTFVLEADRARGGVATEPSTNDGAATNDGGTAAAASTAVRVAAMESAGGYDTPRMAYSQVDGEVEYFVRHRWAETPAAMFAPILVAALERTGRYSAVLAPSSRADADLLVEAQLLAFRVDAAAPAFRATLRATLVQAIDGRALRTPRTFDVVEPMAESSPGAGAKAAQRAAARLADEVAAYCAGAH